MTRALVRLATAAGCGALLSLAWHPVDAGWLAWFGLAPFLVLAELHEGRGFLRETYVFGVVLLSLGCWWLYELTLVGGLAMALAVLVLERAGPGHELDDGGAAVGAGQRFGEDAHRSPRATKAVGAGSAGRPHMDSCPQTGRSTG